MMTKTDYEGTAAALRSLPVGARVGVYNKLIKLYASRSSDFDPYKFGKSMGLPNLFCLTRKQVDNLRGNRNAN